MRVVIPCNHSASTLRSCLDALMQSTIQPEMDIVVVNDGQYMNLEEIEDEYPVTVIHSSGTGNAGEARNRGAFGFHGDVLVFLDADVVVEPSAIETLISPIRAGIAHATVGSYSRNIDGFNFAQTYKQLYLSEVYSRKEGFIQNHFWTALGAIDSAVFFELGGFSTEFSGACGEDMELGQRLTKARKKILAVPLSVGKHLKQLSVPALIRNDFFKGSNCVYLSLRNRNPITHNRHSTTDDVLSVFYAYIVLVFSAMQWLFSLSYINLASVFPLLLASYLASRHALLFTFKRNGCRFFMKAVLLMFLLDLVRGGCVVSGVCQAAFARVSHQQVFSLGKNL